MHAQYEPAQFAIGPVCLIGNLASYAFILIHMSQS